MKAQEIRESFANFFIKNGHEQVSSSPLIPQNDPTLLFANAGMNQFKDIFIGKVTPDIKRKITIQKCVRAGGKHNDLENVGLTARHHTFFEMLGNFSFGDYFKKDAIEYAWKFLTEELKIPKDKLYVTVHHTDDEAYDIWTNHIKISAERVLKKGDKDNFWEMGEFGPCGPCSEIFYDHGKEHETQGFIPSENQDILDDENRYVEVWNLVFMQFEKTKDGINKLPRPSIDTGAGLERLAAVKQGKYWNYDTDIFQPIIEAIENLTGKKYIDSKYTSCIRIIADHIRSSVMLITDGVTPSNEGRGYVLRRIIRRAIKYLRELEAPPVSFYKLIPSVLKTLGSTYPENANNKSIAEKFLQLEEKKFLETLEQGIKFLDEAIKSIKLDTLSGDVAFKLYDTYGFPVDLTEIILNEKELKLNKDQFDKCMIERKEMSKKSWKSAQLVDDTQFFDLKEKFGSTIFTGYDSSKSKAKLLEVVAIGDNSFGLVFDKTPFYGESGGQAGDSGKIENNNVEIYDTQKYANDLYVHLTKDKKDLTVGDNYTLCINKSRRDLIARNHTATHLLQSALIKVLGDHVKQSGSLVTDAKLRFDFTHLQAVTKSELDKVEKLINEMISEKVTITSSTMTKDEAISAGALALFGEKYGDEVRVIQAEKTSTELCGGTHIKNTSEIGVFKIISESSLSTGIRRIEAITSTTAINELISRSKILEEVEFQTKVKSAEVIERIESMMQSLKSKQKHIEELMDKIQSLNSKDIFANSEVLDNGLQFNAVEAPDNSDLRKLSDLFSDKNPNGILLIWMKKGDKVSVLIKSSKQNKKINSSNILKECLPMLGGRGGGRPDMAQGSASKVPDESFINAVKAKILSN